MDEPIKFLGIDPGLKGGLVLISDSGKILDFIKMPVRKDGLIDHAAITEFISKIKGVSIFLERAVSFGMGTTGAFTYGRGFAAIEIAIELSGNRFNHVYPTTWTRLLHKDQPKDIETKEKSLRAARSLHNLSLFPKARTGKIHDGLVDAYLIAEYGRRTAKLN